MRKLDKTEIPDVFRGNPAVTAELAEADVHSMRLELTIRPRGSSRTFVTTVTIRPGEVWEV